MVDAENLAAIRESFAKRFSPLGLAFRDTGAKVEPFRIVFPPIVPKPDVDDSFLWAKLGEDLGQLARDGLFSPQSPFLADATVQEVEGGPYSPDNPSDMMDAFGLAMEVAGVWSIDAAIVSGASEALVGVTLPSPGFASSPLQVWAEAYKAGIHPARIEHLPPDAMYVIPGYPEKLWIECRDTDPQVEAGPVQKKNGEVRESIQVLLGAGVRDDATIARISLKP